MRRCSHKYLSPDCMVSAVKLSSRDIPVRPPSWIVGPRDADTLEEVKSFDRMWFAMNPGQNIYYRMVTRPEIEDWQRQGKECGQNVIVAVEQFKPGVRQRSAYMELLDFPYMGE